MEGNLNECTTGVLIDIDDRGNDAVDTVPHLNLCKTTNDAENVPSLDNCKMSSCITDESNNIHLGGVLNGKKETLSIPKQGWETPSPKSMNKIWKEASKIIDQLHSSPLESTEVLLVDEDFPASFPLEEGCFSGSSPESEKDSVVNEDVCRDDTTAPFPLNGNCLEEPRPESDKVPERKKDSTENNIPMFNASYTDTHISPTKVFNPDVSEQADLKLGNDLPENITHSNKLSEPVEPVSTSYKFKTIIRNVFKTPIKSTKIINKENGSERKSLVSSGIKFPQSNKLIKTNVLAESNKKGIGITKSEPHIQISLKKNCTGVLPEKINNISKRIVSQNSSIGTNLRTSFTLPRSSKASLYQPASQEKPVLCKTSSVVETPNAPKFIRRANSFQTQIGKNSTIKRPETRFEQKSFISANESVIKISNLKTPSQSSMKPVKSRVSTSQIPNNGLSTPLKRSNSLTKKSGIYSSQIPGPSTSVSARKVTSVAEDSRNLFKRPVVSTSSRVRFCSRLDLPSTLPGEMNDNLARKLFSDLKAPRKI